MPARTAEQLQGTHSQYLDAADADDAGKFRGALNEVMPRIYKMGFWREMLIEHTQDASDGYVSLPQNTDSIVAAIIDNSAVPTRSLWHDYKLFGTNDQDTTILSSFIDDGYSPTYRDLDSSSEYTIRFNTLKAPYTAGPATGTLYARYRRYTDATAGSGALTGTETVLESDSYTETSLDMAAGYAANNFGGSDTDVTKVLSLWWNNMEADHPVRIQAIYKGTAGGDAATDSTKDLILADINTNNGVSRYRRYRIGGTNSTSSAHMLLKRCWVDVDSGTDLVHIPATSILKHALLGKLSEDNADVQRAEYHWGVAAKLLEEDMDSYRGAAKPALHIAPEGIGSGMGGMY